MAGVLLDTHALFWLVTSVERLSEEALLSITDARDAGRLFVSRMTAWELSIASHKPAHRDPPNLGAKSASRWFSQAIAATGATLVPIRQKIACEAAAVVDDTGHKDPGDCYLIATARVRKVPIITRDAILLRLASVDYLTVVVC